MSSLALAHTTRADAATFSNGSWSTSLPLNNLKDPNIDKVARSTNALSTSTIFAADMGANYSICAVALVAHNCSTSGATWRVKGGTVAPNASNVFTTGQVFDSGVMNVRAMSFAYDIPSDWGAQYNLIYSFASQTVRYITVDIVDTANTAGYVQFGRLFVPGYQLQPGVNAEIGLQDVREELSTYSRSDSGKRFFTKRTPRPRGAIFKLPRLTASEVDIAHELDALIGITEEVLYIPDPADVAKTQRYGFLGTMKELSALEYQHIDGGRSKAYRIDQKM